MKYVLYTQKYGCPKCMQAKIMLDNRKIEYETKYVEELEKEKIEKYSLFEAPVLEIYEDDVMKDIISGIKVIEYVRTNL